MSIFVESTTGAKLLIGRGSFGYTVEAAASAPLDPVRASPGSSPHSHKIVCIKSVLAELHVDGKPYVRQSFLHRVSSGTVAQSFAEVIRYLRPDLKAFTQRLET
jgi:hypothetical protein